MEEIKKKILCAVLGYISFILILIVLLIIVIITPPDPSITFGPTNALVCLQFFPMGIVIATIILIIYIRDLLSNER